MPLVLPTPLKFPLMINLMKAPCYKCDKRQIKCHSWCKAYAEYTRIRKDFNEKNRELDLTYQDYRNSIKDIDFKLKIK